MDAQGTRARCVVWRERGTVIPAQLERALVGAGCVGVHVKSEFEAVVQLCKAESGEAPKVLLVVEPAQMSNVGEVLELVERYVPGVLLWAYESSPAERIRAVTDEERASWRVKPKGWLEEDGPTPEPRVDVAAPGNPVEPEAGEARSIKINPGGGGGGGSRARAGRGTSGPRLKLAGEGPIEVVKSDNAPPVQAGEPETPDLRAGHMLTDEELAMLLAIEPDKGQS